MEKNISNNTPNAGRLIKALRSTGYGNYDAIADLVDNSLDAGAANVWIEIEPVKNDFRINISDDGCGMDKEVLDQAMRLGSNTERNSETDLGKFGMGLVTASISISKRLTVITNNGNGFMTSIQDLDDVIRDNAFEKELRQSTPEEISYIKLATHNSDTGTSVVLEKCDLIQNKNITQISTKLKKDLGQIFRMFIKSGKNIYVAGDAVRMVDPLMLDEKETEVYCDDSYLIKSDSGEESIDIKLVRLPAFDQQTANLKEVGITKQGLYIIRNNREIASADWFGIRTKHNSLNRVRGEISFSGNLDDEMGVTFSKRGIKPKQNIMDKLHEILYPQIVTLEKKYNKETVVLDSIGVDHDTSAEVINKKSMLLIKPKALIGTRGPNINHPGGTTPVNSGEIRKPSTSTEKEVKKMNCQFIERNLGASGQLFEAEQYGKTTQIAYNIEHPFYQKFIVVNKGNQDIVNAVNFLIYSIASAQLTQSNEENVHLFDNYMSVFSSNLRTLID